MGLLPKTEPDPSARLVALSGYSGEEDARRARAAGFDHHFVKPVRLEVLDAFLSRLVRPASALARPGRRPATAADFPGGARW